MKKKFYAIIAVSILAVLSIVGVGIATYKPFPAANQFYGITWNQSTDTYTRTGALAGVPAAATVGNNMLPIQAAMRRCVLSDAGVVQYYLSPTDSTKKMDGSAANLDGTDGQVMVEIPKFYVRYSYAANVHTWEISLDPLNGFVAHPAFFKDGAWVNYRYIGAYEGSMYDDSESAMATDANAVLNIYAAGDKLCSVTGQCPKTNETRAEFRAMASARGNGWRQQDYYLTAAIQLLYLVEYASFNSQSTIGNGRTMFSGGTWTVAGTGVGDYIGRTGYSNSLGNATGRFPASQRGSALNISAIDTSGADYLDYMSYRGIENFYGNTWKWVDGINIGVAGTHDGGNDAATLTDSGESWPTNSLVGAIIVNSTDGSSGTITANTGNTITATLAGGTDNDWDTGDAFYLSHIVWLCNNEANYADDTYTNYSALYDTSGARVVLHNANGYAGALEQIFYGFLAADVTGSASTKITDYYYQATGRRVVCFGGHADTPTAAGAFYVVANAASSVVDAYIGGRLCY